MRRLKAAVNREKIKENKLVFCIEESTDLIIPSDTGFDTDTTARSSIC